MGLLARIVGGRQPGSDTYLYHARLFERSDRSSFCGASIIDDQWVLTAAHCCEGMNDCKDNSCVIEVYILEKTFEKKIMNFLNFGKFLKKRYTFFCTSTKVI